ncbi:hypothetical protein CPC08DRAFT_764620 [Agrocybe pediades]|nr:hypothetical protein CPC08DRAFT_764620 [Agrocybe pediades]
MTEIRLRIWFHRQPTVLSTCTAPDGSATSTIGTYARPSWTSPRFIGIVLHHEIDLAIAWDFDKTVKDAYRWISENYEDGDLIFMFGFSRGAFQVRVLSAMIEKVGLLHKAQGKQAANTIRQKSSSQKVHFVGVWDAVSSIGTVRGAKMLSGTIDGMKHVCFFRHALALDERRVKFLPEYANGGKGPESGSGGDEWQHPPYQGGVVCGDPF